jgi:hypothetical protein
MASVFNEHVSVFLFASGFLKLINSRWRSLEQMILITEQNARFIVISNKSVGQ